MGQGISEILPFAIGVAISPIPIIAVILMLFSARAKVNGPIFLLGWVIGLGAVVAVVYAIADAANAASDSTSSDTISWLKVGLGAILLGAARRQYAKRPGPGEDQQGPHARGADEVHGAVDAGPVVARAVRVGGGEAARRPDRGVGGRDLLPLDEDAHVVDAECRPLIDCRGDLRIARLVEQHRVVGDAGLHRARGVRGGRQEDGRGQRGREQADERGHRVTNGVWSPGLRPRKRNGGGLFSRPRVIAVGRVVADL